MKNPDKIGVDALPSEFTWENFEGYNFVGDKTDQKGCGSCYVVASTTMLESRIMLYYGEKHDLSSQFPMQCNFMNEGCHGGWGLFNGMFLEDYYTVARNDAPYKAMTEYGACSKYANAKPLAKVAQTYYVGGHYGGMSERDMMWELRARGPFLLDFDAGHEFMVYSKGILSQEGLPRHVRLMDDTWLRGEIMSDQIDDAPNDMTYEEYGLQYEKLTHSTLLIGWGNEEKSDGSFTSYWIVRNSYGPYWGEEGNFRLRRGLNDFAAEGENSALVPLLFNEDGTQIRPYSF